jgi:hypothetical protein
LAAKLTPCLSDSSPVASNVTYSAYS